MSEYTRKDLYIGRILSQDKDHAVIEVGKREDVTFQLEDGDEFLTILFVRAKTGGMKVWHPFRENSDV